MRKVPRLLQDGKPAYDKMKKKLANYEKMLKRGKVALDKASKKCEVEIKARQHADEAKMP